MKYISITFILAGLVTAGSLLTAEAHTSAGTVTADGESQVTEQEFEEIQDTMIKMMNGEELSEAEIKEMNEFMAEHHGGFAPTGMMSMHGGYAYTDSGSMTNRMMGGWGMQNVGYMSWLGASIAVVWLLAGLLLVVFLVQKILNNK